MVDGMATWWQSPPLSRGMRYNKINITIDLEQVGFVSKTIVLLWGQWLSGKVVANQSSLDSKITR